MVIQFVISCLSLIKYIYTIVYCQTWCLRNKSRVHFVTALLWKDFAMRAYWNWGHTPLQYLSCPCKKIKSFSDNPVEMNEATAKAKATRDTAIHCFGCNFSRCPFSWQLALAIVCKFLCWALIIGGVPRATIFQNMI